MTGAAPSALASGTARRATPGWRRTLLPAGLGLLALGGALGVQQVFDPFRQDIPLCPVQRLTGLHCPGCGATRCVHALLDGDLLLAAQSNILVLLAIPVTAVLLVLWAVRRAQGRTVPMPPPTVVAVIATLALAYGVLRNLPVFSFLAPPTLVGA